MQAGDLIVGKYKLERPLGAGGMGAVWVAEQQPLARKVAFKVLKRPSDHAEARFFREMQALARITHGNVVAVYDSGRTEEGALYIAMELVDGPTLRQDLAARGRLSEDVAGTLIKQITAGLAAAHEQKIAHHDLKPENIVLHRTTHGPEAKILDFGIARMLERETSPGVTEDDVAVGTPGYMSPEQLLGVRDDLRSDLYALGVIWFELLTGRAPYTGATTAEIASKTLTEPAPRANTVTAGCASSETEALIASLLARDPAARPADAGALLARLGKLVSPTADTATSTIAAMPRSFAPAPMVAAHTTSPTVATPTVAAPASGSKRVALFAAAALVVVVVAVSLAAALGKLPGAKHAHDGPLRLAVLGFEEDGGDPATARIVADSLAQSLAGLPGLRVLSPLLVAHALREANGDALDAANKIGADFAVTGVVRRTTAIHVDASLNDLRGGDAAGKSSADGADVVAVVDDLVPKISVRVATLMHPVAVDARSSGASVAPATDPPREPEGGLRQDDVATPKQKAGLKRDDGASVKTEASVNGVVRQLGGKDLETQRDSGAGVRRIPEDAPSGANVDLNGVVTMRGGKDTPMSKPASPPAQPAAPSMVRMSSKDITAYGDYVHAVDLMAYDLVGAEQVLARAASKDPDAGAVFLHLALVRSALYGSPSDARVKDALAGVKDPQSLMPPLDEVYVVMRALSAQQSGVALDAAKKLRDHAPDDPIAWALLANAWLPAQPDKAIDCLHKSIALSPDIGMLQMQLASLLAAKGEKAAAVASLRAYVVAHPNDLAAQAQLASLHG